MEEAVANQDAFGVDARADDGIGRRSLLIRVGVAMSAIAAMAIASMLASVIIAQTATGDAEAINKAGTLRMQAYRLADAIRSDASAARLKRYAEQFSQTLDHRSLTRMIADDTANVLRTRYDAVRQRWRDELAPAVIQAGANQDRYLAAVSGFVGEIDALVDALETAAADRIRLLRFGQGTALFITVVLILLILHRLMTEVLPALRELLRVVTAAQNGDLSQRTHYRANDEIGALARTFNGMADNLQTMYQGLEQRVAEQTSRLRQSNDALQLFYNAAQCTERGGDDPGAWAPILAAVEDRLATGPVVLDLGERGTHAGVRVTRTGTDPLVAQDDPAPTPGATPPEVPTRTQRLPDGGVRIPVVDNGNLYGTLTVASAGGALSDWQRQLAETVAGHIASARARHQREAEQRRLALMEERSAIARELHDSLAQALSYLKIQTARLEHELRGQGDTPASGVVTELRQGLNSAYRQLRELLHTFRLQLAEGGAYGALDAAAREFSERGGVPVTLSWEAPSHGLSPNEELHVVQIVREALANVIEHANASAASVTVSDDGAAVRVCISDDGRGLPCLSDDEHHHGLTIMTERARSVGGELTLACGIAGGTRVTLVFQPAQSERPAQTTEEPAP
jgi:two-component system nitrate/nitrite sensor histidine kinase NarX